MVVKKTSTGLVGLAVDVNGRANFIAMQRQILDKIKVRLLSLDARNVLDAQDSNMQVRVRVVRTYLVSV